MKGTKTKPGVQRELGVVLALAQENTFGEVDWTSPTHRTYVNSCQPYLAPLPSFWVQRKGDLLRAVECPKSPRLGRGKFLGCMTCAGFLVYGCTSFFVVITRSVLATASRESKLNFVELNPQSTSYLHRHPKPLYARPLRFEYAIPPRVLTS